MEIMDFFPNIEQYILILLRISGYVFVSPVFGRKGTPAAVKILLSLLLSYMVFTTLDQDFAIENLKIAEYTLLCIKETILGIVLGFSTVIFFSVFYTAGQMIDSQMGFQMGGLYDPQADSKVPISGNLFYVFAFLIFIQLKGHLVLIRILHNMFITVPLVGGKIHETIVNILLNGFYTSFAFAVKLILPVILIMLIVQFVLGVVVKFIPQINIFIIGIPLKIAIGLLVLFLLVTPMADIIRQLFGEMFDMGRMLSMGMS